MPKIILSTKNQRKKHVGNHKPLIVLMWLYFVDGVKEVWKQFKIEFDIGGMRK